MYRIVEQNDQFILINKSAGIAVHKDQEEAGLAMLLKQNLGLDALFPVHRLDKVTSGLMLFARQASAAAELSEQFRLRQVEKYYLAISATKPQRKQGLIVGDMVKARRGSWKLLKTRENPAVTQFLSRSLKPGYRLFLLKPATGKTHQIRVALKSEGAPILGDPAYNGATADRTYLHAYALRFQLNGHEYYFTCLPDQGEHFDAPCRDLVCTEFADPGSLNWPGLPNNLIKVTS
ncbi:TIGR01621 family pseudouridine synthase [Neptuniibacter halophilus]|uniref:TIGR01621 family pseudouridine synthase n=1 Tax=Neptuniibacter halophilus TaxID=651666 RepID=UPI002572F175|nr:TIGR01621 family pseudouridine synthase [Neptuniibacter halophilus]